MGPESIGFIGLGNMGYPMASNLRRKMDPSATLFINEVHLPTCSKFEQELSTRGTGRVITVDTPRELAEQADIVISIVPAGAHVKAVYLDPTKGVIAASRRRNRLLLDCTTIDPKISKEVGRALEGAGAGTFVDTPVSGGPPKARAGTLAFLIGQPEAKDSLDTPLGRLIPTLSMMGDPSKFFFCGSLGAGLAAKLSNNYLTGTILVATAEAMAIGIKSGIDKHLLYNVVHNCTGQSFMCDNWNPVPGVLPDAPASKDYEPGAKTHILLKDMKLVNQLGGEVGVRTVLGSAAQEFLEELAGYEDFAERDMSIVYRYLGGSE